jgi:hypothetical protein
VTAEAFTQEKLEKSMISKSKNRGTCEHLSLQQGEGGRGEVAVRRYKGKEGDIGR